MKYTIATAALVATHAQAASKSPVVVEGPHPGVPTRFSKSGIPNPDRRVELTVAVKQNAEGKKILEQEVNRRSDPDNLEFYGKWLKKDEIDALVQSSDAAVESVTRWLIAGGATGIKRTEAGDFVSGTVTVRAAEKMMGSHFHLYTAEQGEAVMRLNQSYMLPADVAEHVDYVGPSWHFPKQQRAKTAQSSESKTEGDFNSVTPEFLRKLYNAESEVGRTGTKNIVAVASFLGQFYSPSDLAQFFNNFAQNASVTIPTVFGPNTPSAPGGEASLDIQYAMGVARDIPAQFWSTAGKQPHDPENEPFSKWLMNVSTQSDDNLFKSVSISYGDDEAQVYKPYAERVSTEFQKLGGRGVSIMVSSGDSGFYGDHGAFPAGVEYVTSVGATMYKDPEVAANDPLFGDFMSGGGWSSFFKRPSWQDDAVSQYLKETNNQGNTKYNIPTGRANPDVSAQGTRFQVVLGGAVQPIDGTSASCPAFNGIIALLNEARLAAGKSSLGPLNQLLYKKAGPQGALNDITSGDNGMSNIPTAKGWDPVTGLGTPDFQKLKAIVLALP